MDIALVAPPRARVRPGTEHRAAKAHVKTPSIVAWMLVAMAAVTALAYWDEQRESRAALDDLAQEQATLAGAVASSLGERLANMPLSDALHAPPADLLAAVRAIEQKGLVRVLLARPGGSDLVGSDGSVVVSTTITRALDQGQRSLRLQRAEAAALALPARTAVAGLHRVEGAELGRWGVAVIATARAERDREVRAQWRLVLGVTVASGLVLAFGGLAMRKQRKELELGHQLVLTQIRTERDERLVRADKLATMGALATGIAHEVSTPLGVILGRAEQLLPKQLDDRARRAVEIISDQTERIFAVIRGFLGLARGGQPALQRCDPAVLAQAATGLVEHRFDKGQIRLHVELDPDLPKVDCDARLFEQVLVNLLLNACDACSEGGKVALSVHGDGQRVAFVVSDDGVGISQEVAERATEPFFTTKPEGKGTGLGLAIANEIVKHHRGTLTLSPGADGRGTRVCVELPTAGHNGHG
jgi:two-component system NtrC family sensor kinase